MAACEPLDVHATQTASVRRQLFEGAAEVFEPVAMPNLERANSTSSHRHAEIGELVRERDFF
jgi:hypothetical protein